MSAQALLTDHGDDPLRASAETAASSLRSAQHRRIAYFMLFRLGLLAAFTVLAGALAVAGEPDDSGASASLVWATLVVGYGLTIAYAWGLPRTRQLSRFAWTQTGFDILLAAVGVELSGGIESGLVMLYPMAVLGAATMGDRRQARAAAIACCLVFTVLGILQIVEVIEPVMATGHYAPLALRDALTIIGRTLAAIVGVTLLSSYLAVQLQASVSQVGNLQALNEHIVRSLSSGLITLDRDDSIRYFNPAARQILGLDDALIGGPVAAVFPDLPPPTGLDRSARLDSTYSLTDGGTIRVGLTRMPMRDASGGVVGTIINFQDVTQLHELGERVRRSERLAALGAMAASVAHEIRNPLAAISGSAELLAMADAGEEDRRLLAIIRRESNRLSDMVRDLLAFTRPRQPQLTLLDLSRSVRETTEAFAADPSNAAVEVEFVGAEGLEVEVDPVQVGQVVWNLLRNAAEAMQGKGVVKVTASGDARSVSIEISDSGVGIAPERLKTIFDPFFTTKEHGTGFGLAIVHRVIDDNGGTIRVRSQQGVGTAFTVAFPRAKTHFDSAASGILSVE